MHTVIDWGFVGIVVTIVGALIAGFRAYGRHEEKIEQHQKAIDSCHMEDVMTVPRCEKEHRATQEQFRVELQQYQQLTKANLRPLVDDVSELKSDTKLIAQELNKLALQLSGVMGQITTITAKREER